MSAALMRAILSRVTEMERRLAGMEWRGRVTDVDKSRIRIEVGTDEEGNPVKSPWVPVAQRAGALKLHSMPSVGEVVSLRSESGDIRQAVANPYHWSEDNQSPSDDPEQHKLTFGPVTVLLTAGGVSMTIDGTTFNFTATGYEQTGGHIKHDDVVIDKTHDHSGVFPGAGYSGPPRA